MSDFIFFLINCKSEISNFSSPIPVDVDLKNKLHQYIERDLGQKELLPLIKIQNLYKLKLYLKPI